MLLGGTFVYDTLKSKLPTLDFGVAPHPYFAKGKPVTPTVAWHFGVNPRSTQQPAVAQFVRDMLSDDMNVLWFKLRPYVPTVKAVWTREAATFNTDVWRKRRVCERSVHDRWSTGAGRAHSGASLRAMWRGYFLPSND